MFNNCAIRAFALVLGSAALYSGSQLAAAPRRTETVNIPFAFQVHNVTLPAGEYRLERDTGSEVARVVNVRTRRSVQMLRSEAASADGSVNLTFVQKGDGYQLKIQ